MPKITMDSTLAAIGGFPQLHLREVVRLSPDANHGLLLSERDDSPGVLGLGAVDRLGDVTALGLTEAEARQLRDAIDRWLDECQTAHYPASAPDPWTDPDAAAALNPPPF